MKKFEEFNNINIFLTRLKKYNPAGRSQTKEEAIEIDKQILLALQKLNINYLVYPGTREGYDDIVELVMSKLGQ